jgi:hypothetical protein
MGSESDIMLMAYSSWPRSLSLQAELHRLFRLIIPPPPSSSLKATSSAAGLVRYHFSERRYGSVTRSLRLPAGAVVGNRGHLHQVQRRCVIKVRPRPTPTPA